MFVIYDDVIIQISELLSNKEKIILTMTSKKMDEFKYKFMFREKICINKIVSLPYFNNFEYVDISNKEIINDNDEIKCPRNIKCVHFFVQSNFLTLSKPIFPLNVTPVGITHLIFCDFFNELIDIPSSVTHVTFGVYFDRPIDIPSSVTHLTFGKYFNSPINNILTSVAHLTFGKQFNQTLKDLIPSVTHLVLGKYFDQPIEDCIPSSVIYLTFTDMPGLINMC